MGFTNADGLKLSGLNPSLLKFITVARATRVLKPGLSAYLNDPRQSANSLVTPLDKAEDSVPSELRPLTPVRVEATAGLRALGHEASENILQAVRELLKDRSRLKTEANAVSVLDGTQGGSYQWEKGIETFQKSLSEGKVKQVFFFDRDVIGEQNGLPSLLVLLFKSLLSRKDSAWLGNVQNSDSFISDIKREWEYGFAVEICEQYTSSTWLSSLVMLLQTISKDSSSKECLFQMRLVLEFMFEKLQDPEFAFAVSLEPRNNVSVGIQQDLQELMKGCIRLLQAVDSTKEKDVTSAVRKEIRMRIHDVLMTVT
ncbi:hypothetical protein Bca101_073576 [Brassica carinata]